MISRTFPAERGRRQVNGVEWGHPVAFSSCDDYKAAMANIHRKENAMKGMMVFEEEADGNCMLMLELKEDPAAAQRRKMCKVFGHCGAALIEHIVSGCNLEPSIADGEAWFCQSLDNLAYVTSYSRHNVSRVLKQLAHFNVLIVGCYNASRMDRTKWYRVNMDALAEALAKGGFIGAKTAADFRAGMCG
jgi:hypothetical protein